MTHLLLQLGFGFQPRWALHTRMLGAGGEVVLGAQDERWGGGPRVAVEIGTTRGGQAYELVRFGPAFDVRLSSRWRLHIAGGGGALFVHRVTRVGEVMWSPTFGVDGGLAYDVLPGRDGAAVWLGLRAGYDWVMLAEGRSGFDQSITAAALIGYRL